MLTTERIDAITEHARLIQRLANPETLDAADIRQIFLSAKAVETMRAEELAAELEPGEPAFDDELFWHQSAEAEDRYLAERSA